MTPTVCRNDLPTERLPTTAILRCFGEVGIVARTASFSWEEGRDNVQDGKGLGGKDMLSRRDSNYYNNYVVVQL